MGHFLSGVKRVKRFVKVNLPCSVSNLKKISKTLTLHPVEKISADAHVCGLFYVRERIGESNYHDSQGEFWPKLKQCLTDWTKEALPQSFRTWAF